MPKMKLKGSVVGLQIMILSRMAVTTRAFVYSPWHRPSLAFGTATRWATARSNGQDASLSMENLYKEWTLQEDEILWKHRNESVDQLASRLG